MAICRKRDSDAGFVLTAFISDLSDQCADSNSSLSRAGAL